MARRSRTLSEPCVHLGGGRCAGSARGRGRAGGGHLGARASGEASEVGEDWPPPAPAGRLAGPGDREGVSRRPVGDTPGA